MGGHRGPCASCSGVKVLDFIRKSHLLQESLGCWNGIGEAEANGKCRSGQGVSTIQLEMEDGWGRNLGS